MSLLTNIAERILARRLKTPGRLDEHVLNILGGAVYPDPASETFLNSYTGNGDVFTVINKITEPASGVLIRQVDQRENEVPNGRMISLINNPNNRQSKEEFIESILSFYLILAILT